MLHLDKSNPGTCWGFVNQLACLYTRLLASPHGTSDSFRLLYSALTWCSQIEMLGLWWRFSSWGTKWGSGEEGDGGGVWVGAGSDKWTSRCYSRFTLKTINDIWQRNSFQKLKTDLCCKLPITSAQDVEAYKRVFKCGALGDKNA